MGQVVLVTGASSGIGAATARRLAAAGHIVYAAARRTERLAEIASASIIALPMDVTDDASVHASIERIMQERGRIDALINNAGYGSYGAIEEVPLAEAQRQLDVNLFGVARLTQGVLPIMRAQRSGTIVNITSIGGKITTPLGGWYHASKFALEGFSDVLRQEVAPFGVRVVVIEPGGIRTEWGGIAAASAREVSGDGPYRATVDKMQGAMDGRVAERSSDPDVVARAIEKAITAQRPKIRYAVGFLAKPTVIARRLASDRVMDRIQARMFG